MPGLPPIWHLLPYSFVFARLSFFSVVVLSFLFRRVGRLSISGWCLVFSRPLSPLPIAFFA